MTLREQCEALVLEMRFGISLEKHTNMLEQFAKSQQAVGLREAAEYWKQECGLFGPVVDWCEQRAREREGMR